MSALRRDRVLRPFALTGTAAFVLIAPTALHGALFRCGDKEYLVTAANRLTIVGLAAVGVSMATATIFLSLIGMTPAPH